MAVQISLGPSVGHGAIATEGQLEELLGSVVVRVVAGSSGFRADPPTDLNELDTMVLLLARHSVAQARPGLVEQVLGAKRN